MNRTAKYVLLIRRIEALKKAIPRANSYVDKHPDAEIDFQIKDKIDTLRKELRSYIYDTDKDRYNKYNRKKQVLTACRLLGVDYYRI